MNYEGIMWVASVMLAMFSVLIEGAPLPSSLFSAFSSPFPLLSAVCFCLLSVLYSLLPLCSSLALYNELLHCCINTLTNALLHQYTN